MNSATKRLVKILLKSILGLVVFVVLYFTFAYFLSTIAVDPEANSKKDVAIYIKNNGFHTDFILPVRTAQVDWSQEIKFQHATKVDSSYSYLAIGWGAKKIYLETPEWADLKFSVAFNTLVALNETVFRTEYYKAIIESESCKRIFISYDQYQRLILYIYNSFQRNKTGHFINIVTNAEYGKASAFYEAKGRFSLFYSCNTWVNNGLKACGQKACFWTPFYYGIFEKYKSLKQ